MTIEDRLHRRGERLRTLTEVGPGTEMGRLLRRFWQPVAVGRTVAAGSAIGVRALGEDLTLYRGTSGAPHLVGDRCAHRRTVMHTGWIEGEEIRCMYHGWKYDGTGTCTERPAERDSGPCGVRIAGYPLVEYAGLIFAYMGDGAAPPFELPRKDVFEGDDRIIFARTEVWDVNWFQMVENSLDAAHVGFVHQTGRIGTFVGTIRDAVPTLDYEETDAGVRQIATRGPRNVRISDWTFPNNNHISVPGMRPHDPWIDVGHWNMPVDDEHTARMNIWACAKTDPETDARIMAYFESCADYNAADHYHELFHERKYPEDEVMALTSAQDYVAQRGQGTIVDREREILGASDAGVAFLRRLFFRELEALREGRPTKAWQRLSVPTELPIQVA